MVNIAAVFICIGYLALLLVARSIWVVLPNNRYLRAYAEMVKAQSKIEQDKPDKKSPEEKAIIPEITRLLDMAKELVSEKLPWYRWLFTGTGKQLASWRLVHEAERLVTNVLSSEVVQARASLAAENLKCLDTPPSKALAEQIVKEVESKNQTNLNPLLKEAQGMLLDARDNYFEILADWQNKASWLVMTSVLIILALGVTAGNIELCLLGAIGGLLSRLRKVLWRKHVGFDYGVSWSTLFLSPLVGALTGWSGVLLIMVLIKLNVLGTVFEGFEWSQAIDKPEVLALAVAFGFSATLFERMMERVESTLAKGPPVVGGKSEAETQDASEGADNK